jgi:hypothetical protein
MRNVVFICAPLVRQIVTANQLGKSFIDQSYRGVKVLLQIFGGVVVHCLLDDTMCPELTPFLLDKLEVYEFIDCFAETRWRSDDTGQRRVRVRILHVLGNLLAEYKSPV